MARSSTPKARSSTIKIGPRLGLGPSPKNKSSMSSKLDKFRPVASLVFTRQVNFKKTIIGGKCQNSKIQMRHFESFSNKVLDSKFLFSYFREHIRTPWKTTLNSFSCWPPEDFLILVLHLLLDWSTSPEELLLPKATTLVWSFYILNWNG